jgi:hypothetical protein
MSYIIQFSSILQLVWGDFKVTPLLFIRGHCSYVTAVTAESREENFVGI